MITDSNIAASVSHGLRAVAPGEVRAGDGPELPPQVVNLASRISTARVHTAVMVQACASHHGSAAAPNSSRSRARTV